jgi:hypothetical protein
MLDRQYEEDDLDDDDFHEEDKAFRTKKAHKNFKRGYQKEFLHKRSNHHVPKHQESET